MAVHYVPSLQPIEFARFQALSDDDALADGFDAWAIAQSQRREQALVLEGHHVVGLFTSAAGQAAIFTAIAGR